MTNDEKRANVLKWAESQLGVIEWPAGSNKVKYNDWFAAGEDAQLHGAGKLRKKARSMGHRRL